MGSLSDMTSVFIKRKPGEVAKGECHGKLKY
jgi:hypothetical protein